MPEIVGTKYVINTLFLFQYRANWERTFIDPLTVYHLESLPNVLFSGEEISIYLKVPLSSPWSFLFNATLKVFLFLFLCLSLTSENLRSITNEMGTLKGVNRIHLLLGCFLEVYGGSSIVTMWANLLLETPASLIPVPAALLLIDIPEKAEGGPRT